MTSCQEQGQVIETPGGPAELRGECLGLLEGAVRDQHGGCARRLQMAGGDLAHFARAEHQNGVAGQRRAEDLGREFDSRRADGECPTRDSGLGSGALPCHQGLLEQMIQARPDAPGGLGGFQSRPDLPLDIRLA